MKMSKQVLLLSLALLLASCGGGGAVVRYYVIDPVATQKVGDLEQRSIQILDIKLPQYLERFQIASRLSSNQLTFAANHQWGEALRKNLYRTMTRNLSEALGTADVGSSISRTLSTPDYLIRVSLESFEQDTSGVAVLSARYQVTGEKGAVLATRTFEASAERNSIGSYDDMVVDLQNLFGELCLHISETVVEVDRGMITMEGADAN
jgi:uncharacterized lipoprotein YmbA